MPGQTNAPGSSQTSQTYGINDAQSVAELAMLSSSSNDKDRELHLLRLSNATNPSVANAAKSLLGSKWQGTNFNDFVQKETGVLSPNLGANSACQAPSTANTTSTQSTTSTASTASTGDTNQVSQSLTGVMNQTGDGKKFYVGGNQHNSPEEVSTLKNLLSGAGFAAKDGESLSDQVTRFQKANGLDQDGMAGPDTLKTLAQKQTGKAEDKAATEKDPAAQDFLKQANDPTKRLDDDKANFGKLDAGVQQEVKDSMKGQSAAAQQRITDLATGSSFGQLSADHRKQAVDLAKAGDAKTQELLKTVTNTDAFAKANDNVKNQVLDLAKDPANAEKLNQILTQNGSPPNTNAQLAQLQDLRKGATAEDQNARVDQAKIDGGVKGEVKTAMNGADGATQKGIADLATSSNFGQLRSQDRQKLLALAKSNDPNTQALLRTIAGTDRFALSDNRVKDRVLELAKDPANAEKLNQILQVKNGDGTPNTNEQMDQLSALEGTDD
jgi:hypothetical protein